MNRIEFIDNCSNILRQSRIDCNVSQKEIAKRLDRSIKTIQNWESGYSTPNMEEIILWFDALGVNSLHHVLSLLCPNTYDLNNSDDVIKIKDALNSYVDKIATENELRAIFYCVFGNTGSSWKSQLDLLSAYNHLPLKNKVPIAQMIYNNYEIELANDNLMGDNFFPDIEDLKDTIEQAKDAAKQGKNGYKK